MLVYEYKLDGSKQQYSAIEEAIRVVQFIRNKCLRLWMDKRGISRNDLQCYCADLAKEYPFATRLNSQARQTSADRAWAAISRFYENCRNKKKGKKGYPQFQHDNRSIEYKNSGWKLEPDGRHITFIDRCGIGRLRLVGTHDIETFPLAQIKRVRIIRRADGYFCQFAVKAERRVEHTSTGKQVGIDVGLLAYYTDSDGDKVENPVRRIVGRKLSATGVVGTDGMSHAYSAYPTPRKRKATIACGEGHVGESHQFFEWSMQGVYGERYTV